MTLTTTPETTDAQIHPHGPGALPDLHAQNPRVRLAVRQVGHRGVKRLLAVDEHATPVMLVMDVSVGLTPTQRGAHMSRLIDCMPVSGPFPSVRAYVDQAFAQLRQVVPDAGSWTVSVRATTLIPVPDGVKPVEEIVVRHQDAGDDPLVTWGAAFKVCLACPQAQAAIAHDRDDTAHVGDHPSHNQVCDLELRLVGSAAGVAGATVADLVDLAESGTSGKVRERYKRRGEADCVTEVHHNAMFAEDALRGLADALRARHPEVRDVVCSIVNYESIFEYPLHCEVRA
jgi:GTP cyclohydrolase FolE2